MTRTARVMITFHLVFTTKFSVSQRLDAKNEDEVQFLFYTEAGCAYFGRRARRTEVSPDFSRDQNDRVEKAERRLGSRRCGPEARSTSSEGPYTFFMKSRGPQALCDRPQKAMACPTRGTKSSQGEKNLKGCNTPGDRLSY